MSFKLLAIASLALSSLVAASPVEVDLTKRVTETSLAKRAVLSGQWATESEVSKILLCIHASVGVDSQAIERRILHLVQQPLGKRLRYLWLSNYPGYFCQWKEGCLEDYLYLGGCFVSS